MTEDAIWYVAASLWYHLLRDQVCEHVQCAYRIAHNLNS